MRFRLIRSSKAHLSPLLQLQVQSISIARSPMANSLVFSSSEILSIVQENKYLRKLSYFILKLYIVRTHQNRLIEAILMYTQPTIIV